jgi:protein-S-isoprenylcysteine O-methyltransferase Ste14
MTTPTQICDWLWTVWVVLWLLWAFQSKQTRQRESPGSRMAYTVFVWAALYMAFFAKHLGAPWTSELVPYQPWLGWLGVYITALGFAFTIWARAILGGNWSGSVTIKVGHELVRTGPYRLVRHPIYTGMIVALVGTALALDQWRGAASIVLLWISFTIKRLKEEQFMQQTFGTQYDDYARITGAIFPRMGRRSA